MKPRATVDNIQIDEDQDENTSSLGDQLPADVVQNQSVYALAQPSSVKDLEEVLAEQIEPDNEHPLYVRHLGDELPNYRPTMEPEAMKDFADKIKA